MTPPLKRLTTGNVELDEILGGGFPANSIHIVMGEPGTGKTILVERLLFANAVEGDRPILFLTTLSEPLDKVVRHLQQFRFYDEGKLTESIVYDSIGAELMESGVEALLPRLREAITTHRPKIIVLDSFRAIHDLATSMSEMRRMLFDVAGLLTAYDTTAFLVGEYGAEAIGEFPEFAVADSMVELARNKLGTRDERFIRVLKLRGSAYLEGLHAFRIGPDGLEVFPRLVGPSAAPLYDTLVERIPSGIPGLDDLLRGGLGRGRSTFVVGPTGSGKTTACLQFVLDGVMRGEQCLFVSFEENPSQLDAQIRSLGMDPRDARARGLVTIYSSPVELQIDSIVVSMFQWIRAGAVRRMGIDAVGDLLLAASDPARVQGYLYALTQHFAVHGVTSFFAYEAASVGATDTRLSALADNLLLLGLEADEGRGRRTLRVVKARGIAHDIDQHEIKITAKGVEVVKR